MTITLTPAIESLFKKLDDGALFTVSGRLSKHFFHKLAYSRATHDPTGLTCSNCKTGPTYLWNALNAGGTLVHFCPNIAVIPLTVRTNDIVRIVDDNGVTWLWDLEKKWLDVEYEPGEWKPEDSGYPAVTEADVTAELFEGGYFESLEDAIHQVRNAVERTEA
jgi:hypothetical protein